MADFPSSTKTFPTLVDHVDSALAAHQNERAGEITALETYLIETATEVTVSGGVLTVTKSRHTVQPESGTSDDIDTITGIPDNGELILSVSDLGTDELVFKHGTGNLSLPSETDITLTTGAARFYRKGSTVYAQGGGGAPAATGYQISVTVASNNITVALKNKDGDDPSPTNPVKVQIGNTVRKVTAPLSVTVNAAVNTFNAGSAELATKEIDYFAMLSWVSASSTVAIGYSRIPYGLTGSDFSGTATNEKYAAWSTAPGASDPVQVIGRFAATLSASPGYTWSVPTFTPANLIHRPIYATRLLSFTTQISYLGGTTDPTSNTPSVQIYSISGRDMKIQIASVLVRGTGNRSITNFSGPWNTYAVVTSPFNGLESITAAGLRSATAYMSGNLLVFYNSVMANDGSYFAYAQNTLP